MRNEERHVRHGKAFESALFSPSTFFPFTSNASALFRLLSSARVYVFESRGLCLVNWKKLWLNVKWPDRGASSPTSDSAINQTSRAPPPRHFQDFEDVIQSTSNETGNDSGLVRENSLQNFASTRFENLGRFNLPFRIFQLPSVLLSSVHR